MMYWKYLKYVLKHKYFVFIECCKLGILFAGLTHDLSKFLPDEFLPYANYFYGPRSASRRQTPLEKCDFDEAWLKHQRRSGHHWQAWILMEDSGKTKYLTMPERYMREMLADWRGVGRMFGKPDPKDWYLKNRDNIQLNVLTTIWIEQQLKIRDISREKVA